MVLTSVRGLVLSHFVTSQWIAYVDQGDQLQQALLLKMVRGDCFWKGALICKTDPWKQFILNFLNEPLTKIPTSLLSSQEILVYCIEIIAGGSDNDSNYPTLLYVYARV